MLTKSKTIKMLAGMAVNSYMNGSNNYFPLREIGTAAEIFEIDEAIFTEAVRKEFNKQLKNS
jgi:hypothetical protein